MDFAALLAQAKPPKRQTVAVAAAEDPVVLKTLVDAHAKDIANAILCGNEERIREAAQASSLDISSFSIINTVDDRASATAAVAAVREGKADMLMKGLLQTSILLKAVLNKEHGLRGSGLISHVCVLYSPILNRMLFMTDGGMVPYPDLADKVKILENAVRAAHGMGVSCPKVAVLAAVETINPGMPPTLDAAALTAMNNRGQIKGCVVDGPLAMDLALSPYSTEHKGVKSEVAGKADVLLFPNIESANCTVKALACAGHSIFGGMLMGATAPIVVSSRGDSEENKLYSIACAGKIAMNT